jgi:hypothetical protein
MLANLPAARRAVLILCDRVDHRRFSRQAVSPRQDGAGKAGYLRPIDKREST